MYRIFQLILPLMFAGIASAQVGTHPTVFDVAASVTQRLQESLPADQLLSVTVEQVMAVLNEDDWKVLGEKHLSFRINVPATVYVFRDGGDAHVVHWLSSRGFANSNLQIKTADGYFEGWAKDFEPG